MKVLGTFDPNIVLGSFEGTKIYDQATIDSIAAGLTETIQTGLDGKPLEFKFKPPEIGIDEEYMAQVAAAAQLISKSFDSIWSSMESGRKRL